MSDVGRQTGPVPRSDGERSLHQFLAFGREDDDLDSPWWPLYAADGPHMAESAEACIDLIRECLALGGEGDWIEIAAVPAAGWIERRP